MSDTEVAEVTEIGRNSPTPIGGRHEKSLGLLTAKFVDLLQVAEGGVLDLKKAADMLDVKQKRRIYDITNVLEGIGLIEKETKNTIKWKGASQASNSSDAMAQLEQLKERLMVLEEEEKRLEEQYVRMKQCLRNLSEDTSDNQLAYVTHNDVNQLSPFKDGTVMAIQAPVGTQLHAEQRNGKFKMHLRSSSGPINVLAFNNDRQEATPTCSSSLSTSSNAVSGITQLTELSTCNLLQSLSLPFHPLTTALPSSSNSSGTNSGSIAESISRNQQATMQDRTLTLEDFIQSIIDINNLTATPTDINNLTATPTGINSLTATPTDINSLTATPTDPRDKGLRRQCVEEPLASLPDGSVSDMVSRMAGSASGNLVDLSVLGGVGGDVLNESMTTSLKSLVEGMENKKDMEAEVMPPAAVPMETQHGEDGVLPGQENFQPEQVQILKLSPVAGERDYFYHMDEREGLADLYDIHNKT